eukprot:6578162-Prymnesium_polylepis.2
MFPHRKQWRAVAFDVHHAHDCSRAFRRPQLVAASQRAHLDKGTVAQTDHAGAMKAWRFLDRFTLITGCFAPSAESASSCKLSVRVARRTPDRPSATARRLTTRMFLPKAVGCFIANICAVFAAPIKLPCLAQV